MKPTTMTMTTLLRTLVAVALSTALAATSACTGTIEDDGVITDPQPGTPEDEGGGDEAGLEAADHPDRSLGAPGWDHPFGDEDEVAPTGIDPFASRPPAPTDEDTAHIPRS